VLISLTPAGKKEAQRLRALTERSIATILDRIPKSDRPQVIKSLHVLRTATEQTRTHLDCC
jgi:DNA-binding MarR family transcriptional regulator